MACYIPRWYTRPKTVTHPGTNRARRAFTSFKRRTPLTTTPRRQFSYSCEKATGGSHSEYSEVACFTVVTYYEYRDSVGPSVTDTLQRVMNAAARDVSHTRKFDHCLTQILHDDLYWLDVADRVTYKLSVSSCTDVGMASRQSVAQRGGA